VTAGRLSATPSMRSRDRADSVDIAEQAALDLVIDQRAEESRIEVRLLKASSGWPVDQGIACDDAPVIKCFLRRCQIKIGQRSPSRLEKPSLIPSRNVMVVPCRGHASCFVPRYSSRPYHKSGKVCTPLPAFSRAAEIGRRRHGLAKKIEGLGVRRRSQLREMPGFQAHSRVFWGAGRTRVWVAGAGGFEPRYGEFEIGC
jgi:hypothetical protein